jgi:anti-sigma28 factor (negative regulator of flagellin synthesis)
MDITSDISSNGIYTPGVRQTAGAESAASIRARRVADESGNPAGPEIRVRSADSVDISALARRLGLITSERPVGGAGEQPFRSELVERVRAEIEAGTYETPARLEGAIDRLLSDLDVTG